jgi:opacity protein-like surface antigen
MRKTFLAGALLLGFVVAGGRMACAQEAQHSPRFQLTSSDLAVTYTTQEASVISGGNFWMQGAGVDGAITFYRGFGLATSLTGDYASQIAPNVSLGTFTYMAGPRYTYNLHTSSKHEIRIFGEALAGGVKGFDSVFPASSGISKSATAFAWQVGGGVDIAISKHFAIRAVEADFVRTNLPNSGTDREDHLRLALGVTYHTGK